MTGVPRVNYEPPTPNPQPAEILRRIRHTFDTGMREAFKNDDDAGWPDGALQLILDEEGPEALIQAVLDAARSAGRRACPAGVGERVIRHDVCEVCGLPVPRPDGEPPPTEPPRPGVLTMCILDHEVTWWQRFHRWCERSMTRQSAGELAMMPKTNRCLCGHVQHRHVSGRGLCLSRKCFCLIFRVR